MLTCKSVANSLAEGDYADLPLRKRIGLRLHVILCFVCGRYHRGVMRFQNGVRKYRRGEVDRAAEPEGEFCLRSDEREALRRALAAEQGKLPDEGDRT